jgi:hypothetical protein
MALDDFIEPEVAVAVGVTAAVMSPKVRKVLRRGAVYGLAGLLTVGDKLAAAARGVSEKARNLAASTGSATEQNAGATGQAASGTRAPAPVSG